MVVCLLALPKSPFATKLEFLHLSKSKSSSHVDGSYALTLSSEGYSNTQSHSAQSFRGSPPPPLPTRFVILAERIEGCVSADGASRGTLAVAELRDIFITNR